MAKDTRNLLIAAAAELLDQGGPSAVTLREVGKRAGVSHNAPYKHFSDKEELLGAVAAREFARMMEEAGQRIGDGAAIDALKEAMAGYVRWAKAHPARFRLAFGAWTDEPEALSKAASGARAMLVGVVERAQADGDLPRGNAERMASLILALAHGASHLALGGHLSVAGKGGADPEGLLDDLFALLSRAGGAKG